MIELERRIEESLERRIKDVDTSVKILFASSNRTVQLLPQEDRQLHMSADEAAIGLEIRSAEAVVAWLGTLIYPTVAEMPLFTSSITSTILHLALALANINGILKTLDAGSTLPIVFAHRILRNNPPDNLRR